MTTLTKLIISIVTSLLFASCSLVGVDGNGNVTKEERSVASFNSVHAGYGLQVTLKKARENAVLVEADENLQDIIITRVDDNVLYIETKKNIISATKKNIVVSYTNLSSIKATSGSKVITEDQIIADSFEIASSSGAFTKIALKCNSVKAKASSGGILNLNGSTESFKAKASSGGNLNANSFIANNVEARASSGGNLNIYVNESLTAEASSGGNINYKGNAQQLNIENNRSGNINKG